MSEDPMSAVATLDVAEPRILDVVELGDAIAETKQAYPIPIVYDNQHTLGWG